MRIGEVARRTGLKVETVRFYEAEGLIGPPSRSDGNYRVYDQAQFDRLAFIKRARDLGFTLEQVRALLRLAHDPRGACAEVDEIHALHLEAIDRKLDDLVALRAEVVRWGGGCEATTVAECKVIGSLTFGPDEQERARQP